MGYVPNLFLQEDFDEVQNDLVPFLKEKGLTQNKENMIKIIK